MLHNASDPAGVMKVHAPFDRSVIAEVETVNVKHVDQAISIAHELYRDKASWIPLHKRIEIL